MFSLIYDGKDFYLYNGCFWELKTDAQIKKICAVKFNEISGDQWDIKYENRYFPALQRFLKPPNQLRLGDGYLCVKNGLLDIQGGTISLLEYRKDIFLTSQLDVSSNLKAKTTLFDQFLNDIFMGDQATVQVIWEMIGYIFSDSCVAQKFFIFYGTGANGKSVLLDVIASLLPQNQVSNLSLVARKDSFKLSNIVGKKLNIATENSSEKFSSELLKQLTAGESIQINMKYQAPFSYKSTCKLFFGMNQLPPIIDSSYGYTRRMMVIPFNKNILIILAMEKEK